MNTELKKAKEAIRKIERFCKSRPTPTPEEVDEFLKSEGLTQYSAFATSFSNAVWSKEWILHTKKINKSR